MDIRQAIATLALTLLAAHFGPAPVFAHDPGPIGITHTERPTVGLAIGSGGLRSAAAVGVLRVLEDEGIPVDLVVGCGMGAVVGGLYCAGLTPFHIEEQFTRKKLMHAYLTVPLKLRLIIVPLMNTPRLVGIEPYDGLYRGKKFAHYLNKQVPETEQQIQNLKVPFAATALDLLDGRVELLDKGNLAQVLQASSAIPALRKPVRLQDGLYTDSSVLKNIPVAEARSKGANFVIAIDVDETPKTALDKDFHKIGSVTKRVLDLHWRSLDQAALEDADIVIRPQVDGINIISTSSKDADAAIRAGEQAARRAAPAIKEYLEKLRSNAH